MRIRMEIVHVQHILNVNEHHNILKLVCQEQESELSDAYRRLYGHASAISDEIASFAKD